MNSPLYLTILLLFSSFAVAKPYHKRSFGNRKIDSLCYRITTGQEEPDWRTVYRIIKGDSIKAEQALHWLWQTYPDEPWTGIVIDSLFDRYYDDSLYAVYRSRSQDKRFDDPCIDSLYIDLMVHRYRFKKDIYDKMVSYNREKAYPAFLYIYKKYCPHKFDLIDSDLPEVLIDTYGSNKEVMKTMCQISFDTSWSNTSVNYLAMELLWSSSWEKEFARKLIELKRSGGQDALIKIIELRYNPLFTNLSIDNVIKATIFEGDDAYRTYLLQKIKLHNFVTVIRRKPNLFVKPLIERYKNVDSADGSAISMMPVPLLTKPNKDKWRKFLFDVINENRKEIRDSDAFHALRSLIHFYPHEISSIIGEIKDNRSYDTNTRLLAHVYHIDNTPEDLSLYIQKLKKTGHSFDLSEASFYAVGKWGTPKQKEYLLYTELRKRGSRQRKEEALSYLVAQSARCKKQLEHLIQNNENTYLKLSAAHHLLDYETVDYQRYIIPLTTASLRAENTIPVATALSFMVTPFIAFPLVEARANSRSNELQKSLIEKVKMVRAFNALKRYKWLKKVNFSSIYYKKAQVLRTF